MSKKLAVITGAGSGLGVSLADYPTVETTFKVITEQ